MDWMILAAIVVAGTVSTFTDWFFMGVLFRSRYLKYPDTWWPRPTPKDERGAIIWSSLIGYITAAAVIELCLLAGVSNWKAGLLVAALAWAAGPLVVSVTTGIWIKIDPAVTFAHCLGYLARFLIAGLAAGIILS